MHEIVSTRHQVARLRTVTTGDLRERIAERNLMTDEGVDESRYDKRREAGKEERKEGDEEADPQEKRAGGEGGDGDIYVSFMNQLRTFTAAGSVQPQRPKGHCSASGALQGTAIQKTPFCTSKGVRKLRGRGG